MSEINVIPQNDNSGNNSLAMAIIAIVILGIGAYFAYANGWFRMQPAAVNPNPTTSNINVTIPTTPNPITTPAPTSNPITIPAATSNPVTTPTPTSNPIP